MKITKAEQSGNELHLRCECMLAPVGTDPSDPDTVYGLDKNFTAAKAVREFSLLHKHLHLPPPVGASLSQFVGKDIESVV